MVVVIGVRPPLGPAPANARSGVTTASVASDMPPDSRPATLGIFRSFQQEKRRPFARTEATTTAIIGTRARRFPSGSVGHTTGRIAGQDRQRSIRMHERLTQLIGTARQHRIHAATAQKVASTRDGLSG